RDLPSFPTRRSSDPPHGLGDEQRGRDGVGEGADRDPELAQPPGADRRREGNAAPDAEAAGPHGEHPVPDVRDVARGGDVEVDPAADDAGGHYPQGEVVDQVRVAAERAPAPPGDHDRQRDPDDVPEGVEVDVQRADVKAADRRTGNELRQRAGAMRHGPRLPLPPGDDPPYPTVLPQGPRSA